MKRARVEPEMNVTPLVDVVLVLLIIFMVITPQMEKGPPIEVPSAKNVDARAKLASDPLTVKITAEGELWIDEDELDLDAVSERLRAASVADPALRVVLKADRATPYAEVRRLLRATQALGLAGVSLSVGERREGS